LVVKGTHGGIARGWLLTAGSYQSDRASEAAVSPGTLRTFASSAGGELTYTCVPPGAGIRGGIDCRRDGFLDRDVIASGADPADASSVPGGTTTTTVVGSTTTTTIAGAIPYALIRGSLKLRDDDAAPIVLKKRRIVFKSNTKKDSDPHRIHPPSGPGFPSDPTV